MTFTTIAVAGATSDVGIHIARALVSRKELRVRILARDNQLQSCRDVFQELQNEGAEVVSVDYYKPDSLKAALVDIEVVISALFGFALLDQVPLIDAAKFVGVKRFYPSEYGIDHGTYAGVQHPIMDVKKQVGKYALKSGLQVVIAATGFFADWVLSPSYAVDFENATVEIVGDGNTKIGHWPLHQVGEIIAESINHPVFQGEHKRMHFLNAQGLLATWNEILDAHEKATGFKWNRKYISVDEAKKRVVLNNKPFDDFGMYMRIWQAKGYSVSPVNIAYKFSVAAPTFEDIFKTCPCRAGDPVTLG